MFSRKHEDSHGTDVPKEWLEQLQETLDEQYAPSLNRENKTFFLHGELFADEVVLVVGLLCKNEDGTPITCIGSADMTESGKPKVVFQKLLDVMGILLDQLFSSEDLRQYEAAWKEAPYQKEVYHYRISREDPKLTLEASKLLSSI